MLELAYQVGFSHAAPLDVSILEALPEVREMCAAKRCGAYGNNWSCPPGCGSIEQNARQMSRYSGGIIVQTTGQLEDDFDIEGMALVHKLHKEHFSTLVRQLRCFEPDCLPLTAGACTICRKCTYPDKPCRFPKKRFSSMEAYGLLVSDICKKSGLEYNYGPKTMTYTSCILTGLKNRK